MGLLGPPHDLILTSYGPVSTMERDMGRHGKEDMETWEGALRVPKQEPSPGSEGGQCQEHCEPQRGEQAVGHGCRQEGRGLGRGVETAVRGRTGST